MTWLTAKSMRTIGSLFVLSAAVASCGEGPAAIGPDDDLREKLNLQPLDPTPYPPDNQFNLGRIELGRLLFFDPILSGEKDVACGTCHHPQSHFADGRQFGAGVSGVGLGPDREILVSAVSGEPIELVSRNVPTLLNAALAHDESGRSSELAPLMWDGRVLGLERLSPRPLAVRDEMRGDAYPGDIFQAPRAALDSVLVRLRQIAQYQILFRAVFPDEASAVDLGRRAESIDSSTFSRALAAYMRELVTRNSAYDRYVAGDDDALTRDQKRGLILFHGKARCVTCHGGPMFSDFALRRVGVPQIGVGGTMLPEDDLGQAEDTRDPRDRYLFRTPSLRNVELTPPYMHDGVFATLGEVVEFFNAGAQPRHRRVDEDWIDPEIRPLGLSEKETANVVAFLRTLTDPGTLLDQNLFLVPDAVPSGLAPVFGVRATPVTQRP